jgi:tetratricopeptide (TPR) repeat protein
MIVQPSPRDRRWIAVLLAAVVAGFWANSLGGGFHFDDAHAIEQNPWIRSLAHVPRFFVDPDTTTVLRENKDLRPVLLVTFALNHAISGTTTWSWHLVNLVLHWLAAVLVLRIVRDHLWLGADGTAVGAAAALVVAVHPIGTEAVNYLSARSALLTTVFYLGAFDAAVRTRRALSLVLFALALLTKAIAVTLPVVVAGWWWLARRWGSPEARLEWPRGFLAALATLAAAGVAYRLLLLPPWALETTHDPSVTPWVYYMTGWSAYLYYLRLFLWPDALVVDRLDYPLATSILEPRAWASLVGLAILGVLAWRARRRRPALTFAALWYVVTLAPESTVFPLAEPVNEHRPYLAMLGPATAAGLGLHLLASALARLLGARPAAAFAVLVAAVTVALGATTYARNDVWRDDRALWLDATRKAPRNPRAWLNAGHAAMREGDLEEARRLLLEGHRLAPCYVYIQLNLSALAARAGDLAGSLRWADEAVGCNPGQALTHYYRAAALERLGRTEESLAAYRQTTAIDGEHADAWLSQGRLLERRGAWADAAAAYERALAADPGHHEAAMLAALLLHYRLADPARAVALYRRVLAILPTHYGAHYQLAMALLASGREAEARRAWAAFEVLAEAAGDRDSLARAPAALRQR